jgi:hypothetical protein
MISRGNYSVLPLLGILIASIWHIHIALLPALLAVPVAVIVSRKIPSLKHILLFLLTLFIFSLPLLIFEVKHGFPQTYSLISDFTSNHGGGVGLPKLNFIVQRLSNNIVNLFFFPQSLPLIDYRLLTGTILFSALILVKKKVLKLPEVLSLYSWVLGMVIFFTISSVVTSEYYFSNVEVVFTAIVSIFAYLLYKSSKQGKYLLFTILAVLLIKNVYFFTTEYIYHKGYNERKAAAEFIANDAALKGFPCVAVSYITSPGENVGFRYFFWLKGLHVNQPKSGGPVYTIVIPDELAGPIAAKYGHIGVILPEETPTQSELEKSCSGQDSNITDPLFGYTE